MADHSSRARSRSKPAAAIVPSSQRASSVEGSPGKSRTWRSSAAVYLAREEPGKASASDRPRARALSMPALARRGVGPGLSATSESTASASANLPA